MLNIKGFAVLAVVVGAMLMAAVVDFAAGFLSRLVDFFFIAISMGALWAYVRAKSFRSPKAVDQDEMVKLRQEVRELKRENALLRDWSAGTAKNGAQLHELS